jgi:hypothetical protein
MKSNILSYLDALSHEVASWHGGVIHRLHHAMAPCVYRKVCPVTGGRV